MVMAMRYLHLDVFTDRPLEGNQLAVFPTPGSISTEMMQAVTREMNFSECTFVFPREKAGDIRMRIFTPGEELPMAGHPVIGSTFALAAEGVIPRGRGEFVFELGVGPIPVALEWNASGLSFVRMTQLLPSFGGTIPARGPFAAAVGVEPADLVDGLPVQMVSCGVPFLFVPLSTRDAVDRACVDRRAMARCCQEAGLPELAAFFFTTAGDPDPRAAQTVYSRMLAPAFGVSEDPATGSASGPLGCYLFHHGVVRADAAGNIVNLQGVAMRRPSRIHIAIDTSGEVITRVRVGGQAVLVGRGELNV
jgi:trans-2,3-dihydro-3-hydroxyanthranilate isomerase